VTGSGLVKILIVTLTCWGLAACASSSGVYHTVQPGQTLYRIGQSYGVDERYLARINGIEDPRLLQAGKRLFIPGASRRKTVSSSVASAPPPKSTSRTSTVATGPRASSSAPTRPPSSTSRTRPKTSSPPASSASRGTFAWPLRGDLLKKFGQKSSGPSKGLEIAGRRGQEIRSAGAGRVIYSDDKIRGYGNLIILKHEGNLFTVYGYNEQNLVKSGAAVRKGDAIARVGVPPGGGAPRLYFEVRRGKQAVDPLFYLP